ncbi:hypothetical protein CAPTEDRAFT_202960 [Capitella teleta]|uniref:Uncharacterized protein n=1 Tax=Capitella teleta TaxID=283909 RepID=R7VKP1_CAPTE|nr:hypothetical protein CAPTEDRAFT_202960 [Capitella teleta]|eukprot:ELU17546.1 hypothetical protein CAPTEDRAFT_202960 [Capitella teleta]
MKSKVKIVLLGWLCIAATLVYYGLHTRSEEYVSLSVAEVTGSGQHFPLNIDDGEDLGDYNYSEEDTEEGVEVYDYEDDKDGGDETGQELVAGMVIVENGVEYVLEDDIDEEEESVDISSDNYEKLAKLESQFQRGDLLDDIISGGEGSANLPDDDEYNEDEGDYNDDDDDTELIDGKSNKSEAVNEIGAVKPTVTEGHDVEEEVTEYEIVYEGSGSVQGETHNETEIDSLERGENFDDIPSGEEVEAIPETGNITLEDDGHRRQENGSDYQQATDENIGEENVDTAPRMSVLKTTGETVSDDAEIGFLLNSTDESEFDQGEMDYSLGDYSNSTMDANQTETAIEENKSTHNESTGDTNQRKALLKNAEAERSVGESFSLRQEILNVKTEDTVKEGPVASLQSESLLPQAVNENQELSVPSTSDKLNAVVPNQVQNIQENQTHLDPDNLSLPIKLNEAIAHVPVASAHIQYTQYNPQVPISPTKPSVQHVVSQQQFTTPTPSPASPALLTNMKYTYQFTFNETITKGFPLVLQNDIAERLSKTPILDLQPVYESLVFVVASPSQHYMQSLEVIASIQKFFPNHYILFYDLGLTPTQAWHARTLCHVIYKKYSYSAYPQTLGRHVVDRQVHLAMVIQDALLTSPGIFYLDNSIRMRSSDLSQAFNMAKLNGGAVFFDINSSNTFNSEELLTHFPSSPMIKSVPMVKATAMLIYSTKAMMNNILWWWFACSLDPTCMTSNVIPSCDYWRDDEQTSYADCRVHDQSVLNVLLANYYDFQPMWYAQTSSAVSSVQPMEVASQQVRVCRPPPPPPEM